jgi:Flp pilus assembly protein TadD
MNLLREDRSFEAITLLNKALALDTANPFTLNNLGVAEEAIGDFDGALKYYGQVAGEQSKEVAVVTPERSWRGKSVSSMAAASASRLEQRMTKMNTAEEQAVKFTLRGVVASNQNDPSAAKDDFLQAYSLDPNSAFSLNNRGFVAEMEGDLETAQYFYDKARRANDASARIGMATQHAAEGQRLSIVASDSDRQIDTQLAKYSQERRQQTGPIELTPRDNAPSAPQKNP